jgi:Fe-S-cluster containining protein
MPLSFTIDCTDCGAKCCKLMNVWNLIDFPYKHTDGVCEKLEGDRCSIYETRPWQCDSNQLRLRLGGTDDEYRTLQDWNCQEGKRIMDENRHSN